MKRTDLAMIIFIASISILASYFIAKAVVGDTQNKPVTIKTVDPINEQVGTPDSRIFNKDAVNPTVEVYIGGEGERPF